MFITKQYLESIKPKVKGESDKYSWNMYRFLKRHKLENIFGVMSKDGMMVGTVDSEGLSGCLVRSIISSGYRLPIEFWFDKSIFGLRIMPLYLEEYQRVGRCLMLDHDEPWISGDDNRFRTIGNTRRCNWCGKWQHRTIKKIVKLTRKEVWEND